MRILVVGPLDSAALARLHTAGHEVIERPGLEGRALSEALRGTHALVIGGETCVGEEVLRSASALRVIARVGVGLDRVDVAAARELGIAVADTPEAPAVAVAEHAIGLLLALERHLVRADHAVRGGAWREGLPALHELAGRSLGLIGFGRVGREVAWRARAFGMDVLWHDPLLDLAPAGYEWARRLALDDLLPRADVLSLHVPLTRATRGLIGARELAALKSEAVLVNCACGGVVDEDALHAALARGALRGAALDVFAAEPLTGSPLLALPNVVLTPHVAARTVEVARRASLEAAGIVLEALGSV